MLQKQQFAQMAREMLSRGDSFLKQIITGDETWIYIFDTETAQKPSEWRLECEARPGSPRQSYSKFKVTLTVFFYWRGIVHHESLPTCQIVNKDCYLSVLSHWRDTIRRKRPEMRVENSWVKYHNNALSYSAIVNHDFLTKQ